MDLRIVIISHGWVLVGLWQYVAESDEVVLTRCANIRRTHGTRGHFELCPGPLPKSELDPVGTARVPWHSIVFSAPASLAGWDAHLPEAE